MCGSTTGSVTFPPMADVAAAVQEAIVDARHQTMNAVDGTGVGVVAGGGGVLANRRLRVRLTAACAERGVALYLPSPALCTDNGAMVAAAGGFRIERGDRTAADAEVDSSLRLGS